MDELVQLTGMQKTVLEVLKTGHTNKQIATQLQISEETVKEHVRKLLQRVGCTNRTQLAVWAVKKEMLENGTEESNEQE